jgi:hypothetical protein
LFLSRTNVLHMLDGALSHEGVLESDNFCS